MISLSKGVYSAYCKGFQCAIKIADYFLGYRMPEYIFGRGFVERLPQLLKEKDAGKAMAILLPHVMRAYGPAVHKRLAELAGVCGIQGRDDAGKAEKFISWIEDMNRKMDIPEKLDMIKDKDVDQIIRWAMKEANPLYPTPVLWRYDDLKTFIDSVRE